MDLRRRNVLNYEIKTKEKSVEDLVAEKAKIWLEIKDFDSSDSIKTDKGIARMREADKEVDKLKREIAKRKAEMGRHSGGILYL